MVLKTDSLLQQLTGKTHKRPNVESYKGCCHFWQRISFTHQCFLLLTFQNRLVTLVVSSVFIFAVLHVPLSSAQDWFWHQSSHLEGVSKMKWRKRCNKMSTDREGDRNKERSCVSGSYVQRLFCFIFYSFCCAKDALPTKNDAIRHPENRTQQPTNFLVHLRTAWINNTDSTFEFNSVWIILTWASVGFAQKWPVEMFFRGKLWYFKYISEPVLYT